MSDDYEIDLDKSVFTCNLFNLSRQRSKASAVSVSSSDVSKGIDLRPYQEAPTILEYGVTVNICPNKYMNRKKWKIYNHDQQRQILTRIEKSLRQKTPSIQLKDIYYEICPTLQQVHFHALYSMPRQFITEMETYYNRVVGMPEMSNSSKAWRHFQFEAIYDREGWIKYIKKDLMGN